MWLLTPTGFYSAVATADDDVLAVRTRTLGPVLRGPGFFISAERFIPRSRPARPAGPAGVGLRGETDAG
jgi:hypothetical protein